MKVKNDEGDFKDIEEDEKQVTATKAQLPTKTFRRLGICLQVVLFLFNGAAWVIAVLAIIGGLIVGFSSQTININFEFADLAVTTPATLFITYGFALLIVTGIGCFAAASANIFQNICYIVLIVLFIAFDVTVGFWMLISPKSMMNFIAHLRKSLNGYGKPESPTVGIFPLEPSFYWDHLQQRGKCCGLYKYSDWKNASIGKLNKNIPDSCCNSEYSHRFCGDKIWQHPDMKDHGIEDMVNVHGCLTIFPPTLITAFEEITYMGLYLGALLLSCLVLTIVIILIISKRLYDPGQGIANYRLQEIEKNVSALDIVEYEADTVSRKRYLFEGRRQVKVFPANEDAEAGDSSVKPRKVNFLESGPQYIPSQHFVDSDDEHEFPNAPNVASPKNDYTKKVSQSKKK